MRPDPEELLEEFTGLLDEVRAGRPVDTGPLRGRLTVAARREPRHRSRTASSPAEGPLVEFASRLRAAVDRLDQGDADGAVREFRRALHLSMRGVEPPDLRTN